jgi:O-antigen/teichoic acid export membrane protein
MGTLTVLILISSFIQILSDFGLPQALAKFVSELKGKGEDYSAHFIASLTFKTSAALLMSLAILTLSEEISSFLLRSPAMKELVSLTAIYAFIAALTPILGNLLLGTGRLKWIAACDVASTAIRWTATAALVYLGHGVYGAVMGWILGGFFGVLLYAAAASRLVRISKALLRRSVSLVPSLLRFSWPLLAASLITFLYQWYDKALVIAFLPLESVGIYSISFRAFGVLAGISMALGQSLFPYYGMTYGRGDHEAISSAIKRATRYTMLIVFPLTMGLISAARPTITLFAGQQYESGWQVLAIMATFGLTYGISPALTGLLVIYGKTKTVMILNFASVASSLILLPTLGFLGLNGLAVMRGASLLLTLLLTIHFLSKVVRVEVDKETFAKTFVSSAVMAAAVYLAQQVYYSKLLLPLYVLIGAAVYIAEIRAFKIMDRSDVHLLTQLIGERNAMLIARLMGYNPAAHPPNSTEKKRKNT